MAESQALQKVEDQLICAICLDNFKDPKLLQCFHVYCKDCLQRLVVLGEQGQLSLCCPTCRQSTLLPPSATDASSLQSAFHIHHLLEIRDILEKTREAKRMKCEKCNKGRPATSYCRGCEKFICTTCANIHSDWDEYAQHEVVAIEQLEREEKELDVLKKKKAALCCSLHQGKELELYCETCGELICQNCTVKKHKDHQYDLVSNCFERHEAEIASSLEPIEEQLDAVNKALEQLELQSHELSDQRAAIEADIHQQIQHVIELLQARKAELIDQLDQFIQEKMKNLAAQKDELETIHTQLVSCLSFVKDRLRRGTHGEVIKMKKAVTKQIKELTDNFDPDMLPPCELADVKFTNFSPLTLASELQHFGKVILQQTCPEKCYAEGKGLETAESGESATAVVHIVDDKGKACSTPVETVTCELVSDITHEKTDCSVRKTKASQYEISYQLTNHGRHQLHVKVNGVHIS